MTIWEERPVEVANLFNPAFCGEIIRLCTRAYIKEANQGFPYLLTFLVLPILMYNNTRAKMEARKYTYLHNWIQDYPYLRVGFAIRVRELIPITQEALTFLLQIEALTLDDAGVLMATQYRRRRLSSQDEASIKDFYSKAELLGKWFARAGDMTTIYAILGVQP